MKELNIIVSVDPILTFLHQITIPRVKTRRFKKKMNAISPSLEERTKFIFIFFTFIL